MYRSAFLGDECFTIDACDGSVYRVREVKMCCLFTALREELHQF